MSEVSENDVFKLSLRLNGTCPNVPYFNVHKAHITGQNSSCTRTKRLEVYSKGISGLKKVVGILSIIQNDFSNNHDAIPTNVFFSLEGKIIHNNNNFNIKISMLVAGDF